MSDENKVLLRVSNLKQYFPIGKKKMGKPQSFVKANDGISLNIYEGETFGLVGESGCGKSTFGRTLLQLYRQTGGPKTSATASSPRQTACAGRALR